MPELVKADNLIADSITSREINQTDKESNLEVTTTATRTKTSRTKKTGSAVTVMPQDTCKPIVERERLPEHLWWTDTAYLSEETTREFVKLNQKKETKDEDEDEGDRKWKVQKRIRKTRNS
jgi:hypothetical protein